MENSFNKPRSIKLSFLILALSLSIAFCFLTISLSFAQNLSVNSHKKISDINGIFNGNLENQDRFGTSVSVLGALDNSDSIIDIAIGASFDDDGGNDRGAVWILFLNQDGTVKNLQKISDV